MILSIKVNAPDTVSSPFSTYGLMPDKSRNAFLNGIMGFSYTGRDKAGNDVNITLFANSLTQNVHQRDEFSFISNALFAGFLTETPYAAADDLNLPTGQ